MTSINKKKIYVIFSFFVVAFSCVLFKAFQIQIIDKADLITRLNNQTFRETKVYPKRGHIYDRNGSPLAINIQTYSLFTIPQDIEKPRATYLKLAQILPKMNLQDILSKVSNRTKFTWIARKIELTKDQVEKIKQLDGIYIEAVPKRLYPNHETLAQVLGFVGVDNVGLSGLEFLYDAELKGEPRVLRYIRDNKGRPIKFESQEMGSNAKDVHLTIDKDLQAVAENAIKNVVEEFEADGAGIGIMDPLTGELLAVANYPTFDPNELRVSNPDRRRLSFVTDPVEPGSTFKTLTIVSALENKIATPETNYYCEQGRLRVGNHVITEAESKNKYEWLSVEEILQHSSNIGTTKIAFDLTYPKLKKTLQDFGIGIRTEVEIPGESRGILTENDNVPPLSLSNISFGQGVATTGIQMLAAYSAIANGGYMIKPTLVKGKSEANIKNRKKVMSPETSKAVENILIKAVEEGTGSNSRVPNFTIAGKTSTAQRVSPAGGYEGYVSAFIGYPVGVDHPFVIYVYVDNPKGRKYYGNLVAAPVFKKVAEYLLYKNKEFNQLAMVEIDERDSAIDQVQTTLSSARMYASGETPNFVGLDKISAERLAQNKEITVLHRGIGVVTSQMPEPGMKLDSKKPIVLIYKPPALQ